MGWLGEHGEKTQKPLSLTRAEGIKKSFNTTGRLSACSKLSLGGRGKECPVGAREWESREIAQMSPVSFSPVPAVLPQCSSVAPASVSLRGRCRGWTPSRTALGAQHPDPAASRCHCSAASARLALHPGVGTAPIETSILD